MAADPRQTGSISDDLAAAITALRAFNEPVPRPRRLPSESEVRSAEARAGVIFPDDVRRCLLEARAVVSGTFDPITISGGHTDVVTVVTDARISGVPDERFPVCEDNGDDFCVAPSGEVVFWSHNGVTDERWGDLAAWIMDVRIGES